MLSVGIWGEAGWGLGNKVLVRYGGDQGKVRWAWDNLCEALVTSEPETAYKQTCFV